MQKRFKVMLLAMWGVMIVFTLSIKADLQEARNDIAEMQYTIDFLTSRASETSSKIDELQKDISDIQEQLLVPIEPEVPDVPEVSNCNLSLTEDEINLVALVTMAEAEGESEEGKRLVIDTILNRAESKYWASTVSGVIYQPNAFSSVWDGRIERCYVRDDIVQLVREELVRKTNSEVVYFRTGRYSSYGTPMFQVGNHYFSSLAK